MMLGTLPYGVAKVRSEEVRGARRGHRRRLQIVSGSIPKTLQKTVTSESKSWQRGVTSEWLRDRLRDARVRIVDVRSSVARAYIPGAVKLDDAAVALGSGSSDRIDIGEFAFAMARHGIDDGDFVVVYDDLAEGGASRLAALLRDFGHEDVAVLQGGFERWLMDRGPTESTPARPQPASFTARRRK